MTWRMSLKASIKNKKKKTQKKENQEKIIVTGK